MSLLVTILEEEIVKLTSGAHISEVARGGLSKPVRTCFDRGLLEQIACSSFIAGWPHSCHFVDDPRVPGVESTAPRDGLGSSFPSISCEQTTASD